MKSLKWFADGHSNILCESVCGPGLIFDRGRTPISAVYDPSSGAFAILRLLSAYLRSN